MKIGHLIAILVGLIVIAVFAQIARLSAQVEQHERQKHDANCELRGPGGAVDRRCSCGFRAIRAELATLRAERDAAQQQVAAFLAEIHRWRKAMSYVVGDMADTATPEECRAELVRRDNDRACEFQECTCVDGPAKVPCPECEMQAVADLILDTLFVNAFSEQAQRLELRDDKDRGLGGWSRDRARIQILQALRDHGWAGGLRFDEAVAALVPAVSSVEPTPTTPHTGEGLTHD